MDSSRRAQGRMKLEVVSEIVRNGGRSACRSGRYSAGSTMSAAGQWWSVASAASLGSVSLRPARTSGTSPWM